MNEMRPTTHAIGSVLARLRSHFSSPADGLRVLAYHAVGTVVPFAHYGISMEPLRWRAQMETLASSARVVPLSGAPSAHAAVALTFDDGFRDALHLVAPLLVDLRLPATFFITV